MATIHIHSPEVNGNTIRTEISPSRSVSRFFTGNPFEVSYDVPVDSVPDSMLTIPVLAQVCPVAWANGASVSVGQVDSQFLNGLKQIRETFCGLYDFMEGGEIRARQVIDTKLQSEIATAGEHQSIHQQGQKDSESDKINLESNGHPTDYKSTTGLLFTGGVDSTAAFLRHRHESPTLISIRGWTIRGGETQDTKWAHQREKTESFAEKHGVESAFIESNMLSCLDSPMLLAHYKRFVDGGWYSSVGHGLGLLGLCAPLSSVLGIEDIHIAATHWEGIDLEWGSHPDIDTHVKWANTACHHDCYDLTRQERLDLIAEFVESVGKTVELQTCNRRADSNCSDCEKCYRTAIGLRLAGLDPNEHGYTFEDQEYVRIRKAFESGEWVLGQDERYMWEDIQNRVADVEPHSASERDFFNWLTTTDLNTIVDNSKPPLTHRILRAGARNAPEPMYRRLYPVWVKFTSNGTQSSRKTDTGKNQVTGSAKRSEPSHRQ